MMHDKIWDLLNSFMLLEYVTEQRHLFFGGSSLNLLGHLG